MPFLYQIIIGFAHTGSGFETQRVLFTLYNCIELLSEYHHDSIAEECLLREWKVGKGFLNRVRPKTLNRWL